MPNIVKIPEIPKPPIVQNSFPNPPSIPKKASNIKPDEIPSINSEEKNSLINFNKTLIPSVPSFQVPKPPQTSSISSIPNIAIKTAASIPIPPITNMNLPHSNPSIPVPPMPLSLNLPKSVPSVPIPQIPKNNLLKTIPNIPVPPIPISNINLPKSVPCITIPPTPTQGLTLKIPISIPNIPVPKIPVNLNIPKTIPSVPVSSIPNNNNKNLPNSVPSIPVPKVPNSNNNIIIQKSTPSVPTPPLSIPKPGNAPPLPLNNNIPKPIGNVPSIPMKQGANFGPPNSGPNINSIPAKPTENKGKKLLF